VLGLLALGASISPPLYRYQEELQARAAIQRFEREEHARAARWEALLRAGDRASLSFDELAGSLEREIAASYRQSFDQLAAAAPTSPVPSKDTLLKLESYAAQRGQAAHNVAQGLRKRNALQIRSGLAQGQNAAAQSSAPAPAQGPEDAEKQP
jgi:rhomboid protease GluP